MMGCKKINERCSAIIIQIPKMIQNFHSRDAFDGETCAIIIQVPKIIQNFHSRDAFDGETCFSKRIPELKLNFWKNIPKLIFTSLNSF